MNCWCGLLVAGLLMAVVGRGEAAWSVDQVKFAGVKSGQVVSIQYPLVRFSQKLHVAGKDYTYAWLGNTVMGVEPKGEILPLFDEVPRRMPGGKAEGG